MWVLVYPGGVDGLDYVWLGFGVAFDLVRLVRRRVHEPRSAPDDRGTDPRARRAHEPRRAADVADLLEAPLVAILATRRPDDTTMLCPVWFEWRDGGFNVWASASDKGKVRPHRARPAGEHRRRQLGLAVQGDRGPAARPA